MRWVRPFAVSLAAALAVALVFTWPLPRYARTGIPSSAHNVETGQVRTMIPGDHLQLLYHFWLAADMLAGRTPWFLNLYEFNTGDDDARREVNAGYFPFSWFFAAGHALGGRATGYNLAVFLALWGGLAFAWGLARRYTESRPAAALATAAAVLLPFRWANLLGGSPAGFGMLWVPAAFLGLDIAVRDGRALGGVLAGAALLLLSFGDTHGLFFALLAAPAGCAFAFLARPDPGWRDARRWGRTAAALLPCAALAGLALLYNHHWHRGVADAATAGGRRPGEVALFSPEPGALLGWTTGGAPAAVYLGLPLLALWAAGLAAAAVAARRGNAADRRRLRLLLLAALALAAIAVLALGTRGPHGGAALRWARELVPPYRMVRQPAKIFTLVPPLLAVALALGAEPLLRPLARRRGRWAALAAAVLALALAADFRRQVRPTVCRLVDGQGAYRAVARAAPPTRPARALAIPLWPGDSHYGSVYEYYASLHRVRLVNGYRPTLDRAYVRDVFERFESANLGALSDAQADELLRRGIGFLLVHEDLFPEQVSPFPAGTTLERLRAHPRLRLLARDGPVWAFALGAAPRAADAAAPAGDAAWGFPARRFELERHAPRGAPSGRDRDAGGGAFAVLGAPGAACTVAVRQVAPSRDLRWMLRVRGAGAAVPVARIGDAETVLAPLRVETPGWHWLEVPVPAFRDPSPLGLRLAWEAGRIDADLALLASGPALRLDPGESVRIPGERFFHAGWSDPATGAVMLRADWEPTWVLLYGPKLPLDPGQYKAVFEFESGAPAGTALARINVRRREADPLDWTPVVAGREARVRFDQPHNLPVSLELLFLRRADLTVRGVTLTRVE